MKLKNKVAIITGASRGIGFAIAEAFLQEGAKVALCGSRLASAQKAADKLAAYLKCREELAAGNSEFADAEKETLALLRAMEMPEVDWFLTNFAGAFGLTLDGLQRS